MKQLAMLFVLAALLTGCSSVMSNDQIIVEALKCESAGLKWRQVFDYKGEVRNVQCSNPDMVRSNAKG